MAVLDLIVPFVAVIAFAVWEIWRLRRPRRPPRDEPGASSGGARQEHE